MPTREQLLAWGVRSKRSLDLGEGMSITIQQLNAKELQDVVNTSKKIQQGEDDNLPLCAAIICKSAVDDYGARIFTDGDEATLLNDWSYAKLGQLVEPVFQLNGLLKAQSDDTAKN